MSGNQQNEQKQSTPDNAVNDPMKDLVATDGQGQQSGGQGSMQSGDQGGMQSDQQQNIAQGEGGQQAGQQQAEQQQMGSIDQGSMQSEGGGSQQSGQQGGQQGGSEQSGQQGSGQHASGGTPALDDLSGKNQNQTAQQASEAFNQQNNQGSGNR